MIVEQGAKNLVFAVNANILQPMQPKFLKFLPLV